MTKNIEIDAEIQRDIFGSSDVFIRKIEEELRVQITVRNGNITISGDQKNIEEAADILNRLADSAAAGNSTDMQKVMYALDVRSDKAKTEKLKALEEDCICHTVSGRPIHPKTVGQEEYLEAIRNNMITFANGPAGTGKTFLAMAMAITSFQKEEVQRIILTRPAIEAGEKLGFLPGDLQSKIDPYLRPLYDALYQIMGADNFLKNQEKGLIEVAPLAYMRGRTLDNAYIILDEAQNTTPEQMKMFLTRLGFGSKAIITGDITQKDLSRGTMSGLETASKILHGIEGISFINLTSKDVVRHPLVQKIVKAYEDYDRKQAAGGHRSNADRTDHRNRYKG